MKLIFFFKLFPIIFLLFSCSNEKVKKSVIIEKSLDLQVQEAYQEGKRSLEEGDVLFAAKKFNEAEILFPQSPLAPKSALMAAYSYYVQDYYADAMSELIRFKKVYPQHSSLDYANYLLALCYYEQIVDEKKDLDSILKAKKHFTFLINNYPNTEYAIDAEFKIDLINDTLAAKEMYLGRYYFQRKKWIPSINRFLKVINEYDRTIYVQEALHRLVEVHYIIGLKDEAKKYANLLGYNYKSSKWYEMSYSVFNQSYEKEKLKKNKKSFLNKAKSIFD
jgi:outer membrane protein assembly factor BamD